MVELLRTIQVSSCGFKKSHQSSRVSLHGALTKNTTDQVLTCGDGSSYNIRLCVRPNESFKESNGPAYL